MAGARDYNPPPPFFSSPSPFNHQIQHSREQAANTWLKSVGAKSTRTAQDFKSELAWLSSSEAKERAATAKFIAGSNFKKRFPYADMTRFQIQVEFDANRKALGRVLFSDGDGSWENPLIEDQKYWSQPLKEALGVTEDGGFPYQLTLLVQNKPQPILAVVFSDNNITQSIADIFNKEIKIYVTPTDYFTTKFREIFTKTQIKFTTAKYARKWLAKPDMSFGHSS